MSFADPPSWPAFRPRFPWWGADLQTLANRLRRPPVLRPHTSERLSFALDDGTGDTLLGMLDSPSVPAPGRPLVIAVHGLTGDETSAYMLSISRHLLDRGHRVLRINLRGAGPSRPLCGGHYYAGRSQDFRSLLAVLPKELSQSGIVAVGYSLGGAMLLKYLGEEGGHTPLLAAATVSAPVDLAATSRNMLRSRNALYHAYLLRQMKREAVAGGAQLSGHERQAIQSAATIREYDEYFIAPRHGFAGADDYYERCKPAAFMADVRIPTLLVASLDDPWIPGVCYSGYDWRANKALVPVLTRRGGHVGFHGRGDVRPWSDFVIGRFFDIV